MVLQDEWHAPNCGGACAGCGFIAENGCWYPGPTPEHLAPFQQAWAEGTPSFKVSDSGCTCCGPWLVESPASGFSEFSTEQDAWAYAGRQQQSLEAKP